uniref:Uncharacterized protein n=1 Tax=Magallana gigas TaxID=29159 RepID=K1RA52_MAGGI
MAAVWIPILETLNFDLEHGYRMGCIHQNICDSISTQVGHVFGRRADPIEISMTGGCCHGDLCNHHKLTPVAMSTNPPMTTVPTIPTTTAKTCTLISGCPVYSSARYNGQCYFLGSSMMTWLDAKAFCESHCSHLAVFRDQSDMHHVNERLSHDDVISSLPIVHRHNLPDLYVDAVNPAHSDQFMWSTTLEFVPSSLFDNPLSNHLYNCAFVHNRKQLEGTSCTTRKKQGTDRQTDGQTDGELGNYLIEFNSNIAGFLFRFVDGRHEFIQQFLFPVVDSTTQLWNSVPYIS